MISDANSCAIINDGDDFGEISVPDLTEESKQVLELPSQTRNSSGDEIANVNFIYDDIVHAVKIQ